MKRHRIYPINKHDNHVENETYKLGVKLLQENDPTNAIRTFRSIDFKNVPQAQSRLFDIWRDGTFANLVHFNIYMSKDSEFRKSSLIFSISPEEAFKAVKRAAFLKDIYAIGWLALIYDGTLMDRPNNEKAALWYRKAAKFGCLHSIFNLASGIEAKHFEPNSIEELSDLTFALFERAKELPHHIQIGLPKYPSN